MLVLNQREALFGFVAWLSCRKQVIKLGGTEDCAGLPDLIEEFSNANGFLEVSESYPDNLVHPS